ncbi:MAG: Maf family protein, partial [Enterobacteriaceae bacterium]
MTFIYLASASPRRQALLTESGQPFQLLVIAVDEQTRADELPRHYVERMAREKALAGVRVAENPAPVLGADTIVVLDQQILQKPASAAEAKVMLQALSGRCHQVMTAIAFADQEHLLSRVVVTEVCFRPLQPGEIERYIATGEPLDKAGAYGIQGEGGRFVR